MSTITAPITIPETAGAASESARRTQHPELLSLAAALDAAASARAASLGAIDAPGARRRAAKLVAQLRAASRLVANGAHLDPFSTVAALARRASRAATFPAPDTDDVAMIDAQIESWRTVIVALHAWRGHDGSVPASE